MLSLDSPVRAGARVEPLVHGRSRAGHVRRRGQRQHGGRTRHRPRRDRRVAAAREASAEPCLVLATALALDQCLRGLDERGLRFRLASGSALFVTGGFKTRHAELTLEDLLARLEHRLAIAPSAVVQEYGMTELTSQAYTRALLGGPTDLFVGSPWMRIRVLDPRTLEEAATGRRGCSRSSTWPTWIGPPSPDRGSRARRGTAGSDCSGVLRAPSCAAARSPRRSSRPGTR